MILGWAVAAWAFERAEGDFAWVEPPRVVRVAARWDEGPAGGAEADAALARAMAAVNETGGAAIVLATAPATEAEIQVRWSSEDGLSRSFSGDRLASCELVFDGAAPWTASETPPGPESGLRDLERGLLRGLSECLGLAAPEAGDSVLVGEIGEGTGPEGRQLGEDDRAGLQAIYGPANPVLLHTAHSVHYDVVPPNDGACCAGPGEAVGLRVELQSAGDSPIWGASPRLVGVEGPDSYVILDDGALDPADLAPGARASLRALFAVEEACEGLRTVTFVVDPAPSRGVAIVEPVRFETFVQCGGEGPTETGDDEAGRGCGCAAPAGTGATPWGLLGLGLAAFARRRR